MTATWWFWWNPTDYSRGLQLYTTHMDAKYMTSTSPYQAQFVDWCWAEMTWQSLEHPNEPTFYTPLYCDPD